MKLEISKEKELQAIIELAAKICGKPTALLALINEHTEYINFKLGFKYETTSRSAAFCNYVIEQDQVFPCGPVMVNADRDKWNLSSRTC